jgi:hypothetical protein
MSVLDLSLPIKHHQKRGLLAASKSAPLIGGGRRKSAPWEARKSAPAARDAVETYGDRRDGGISRKDDEYSSDEGGIIDPIDAYDTEESDDEEKAAGIILGFMTA